MATGLFSSRSKTLHDDAHAVEEQIAELREEIAALARIKKAAALANKELGTLDAAIADAIAAAADDVITGRYDDQFPVDTYQTGSGTSSE